MLVGLKWVRNIIVNGSRQFGHKKIVVSCLIFLVLVCQKVNKKKKQNKEIKKERKKESVWKKYFKSLFNFAKGVAVKH